METIHAKKKIKIKYVGFWPGFDENDNYFTNLLRRFFEVEITEKPDYIFCSVLGAPYEECKYDGIRIHWNGENYVPDFNIHDYGISFNELIFGDRHLEYPLYLINEARYLANEKHKNITNGILLEKPYFCNFIYGVSRDYRDQAFKTLNTYKKVMSPGTGNNNMPNHPIVKTLKDKLAFQKQCKFTIAFDSTQIPGFVTEKILHAFAAQTIPIYFGSPNIGKYFNKKAFIDVADYGCDLDRVLHRVIELDNDDEKYMNMLKQPTFIEQDYVLKKEKQMEEFLLHIFNQDLEKAFRRSRFAAPQFHNDRLKDYNLLQKSRFFSYLKKLF